VLVGTLAALWAPLAHACDVQASASAGAAPLAVAYTALCDSSAYHWDFGDGTTADGRAVSHTFAAGRFAPTLQTDAGTDALPEVTAAALTLAAPRSGDWGKAVVFTGRFRPGPARVRLYRGRAFVTSAAADARGAFRITARLSAPGPYVVRAAGAESAPVTVQVRPVLEARVVGNPVVGRRAAVVARLRPAKAGALRVVAGSAHRQGRSVSLRLDTRRAGRLRVRVETLARPGWASPRKTLDVSVVFPDLAAGATGSSVRELEQRLAALHYALLGVDASLGQDTVDALYAFQKVQGLPRTGRADAAVWNALGHPREPVPHGGGNRVEVDKEHQVLYVVRGGALSLIVPVSTAGLPGKYTPAGSFSVYRKVNGFDPSPLGVLYDPLYFTGGYAIHGNPSVPPYPASHGCVRVPMWVAARLFATVPYGETVDVY
jgi:hypothetical protein